MNDEKSAIQLGPNAEASAAGGNAARLGGGSERKTFEGLERGMVLAGNVFLPGTVSDELSSSYYESSNVFLCSSAGRRTSASFLSRQCTIANLALGQAVFPKSFATATVACL